MVNLIENPETKALMQEALDRWGFDKQLLVLAEEASELSAAATRILTEKGTHEDLLSEMADCHIMISQILYSLGLKDELEKTVTRKLNKLRKRLEGKKDDKHGSNDMFFEKFQ